MKTVPALETSVRRPLDFMAARVAQTLPAFVPGTSSIVRERNARALSFRVARGEVHRIDRTGGVREIQVLDGVIWLTTAPAEGDTLLRAGDHFSPTAACPVVFERCRMLPCGSCGSRIVPLHSTPAIPLLKPANSRWTLIPGTIRHSESDRFFLHDLGGRGRRQFGQRCG